MDYQLGRHREVIICSVHCATFMRWYEAAHKLIFVGWCVCVCLCTGECVNLKTTAVCFKTPERGVLQSSVFIHFSSFLALKTIITSPLPASPRVWLLQSLLLMGKSMQCLAYGMWIEGLSFLGGKKRKKPCLLLGLSPLISVFKVVVVAASSVCQTDLCTKL